MSGVNKVILVGNLGKDPEVRYLQTGNAVCNLRLATTERRKDGENGWKDHTEWHEVVTWGKTAENVGQYCSKGKQLYVEGRLQTRQYKDKDGNDRYKTEVVAETVQFLGGKGDAPARTPSSSSSETAPTAATGDGFVEKDLPF